MKWTLGVLALVMLVVVICFSRQSVRDQREIALAFEVPRGAAHSPANPLELPASGSTSTAATSAASAQAALDSKRVAVASPNARLEVLVRDPGGRPLAGLFVVAAPRVEQAIRASGSYTLDCVLSQETDSLGRALFHDLEPRDYELACQNAGVTATVRELVLLEPAERRSVELRFPAEGLRAIAGFVVDESGLPISMVKVRLRIDAGVTVSVFSDARGAFEHACAQGREVELSVGGGLWDDDYEPSSLRVPFGTLNARLRRTRVVGTIMVDLSCIDAATGEEVKSQLLSGYRYRAGAPKERAPFNIFGNGPSLQFKDHDDWHLIVNVPGFDQVDVAFVDSLTRGECGNTLVLKLTRSADGPRKL